MSAATLIPQRIFIMKNKVFHFVLIVVLLCSIFMFTGCATPGTPTGLRVAHESWGAFPEIAIPVKDFEPVGLVFTTTTFRVDSRGGITGNVFSYQDLLREAQAVGAHGITNLTIDRQSRNVTVGHRAFQEITIRASALAIRYTTTIIVPVQTNNPRVQRVVGGGGVETEIPAAAGTAAQPRTGLLR